MSGTWLSPMLPILALPPALAALVLYWPYIAGWLGEFRVGMALSGLPKNDYMLLHDVLIPDGMGKASRIDHLICGPAGYFVIESDSRGGRISGRADEVQWTQRLPWGRQRHFANPILHNQRHIDALAHAAGRVPLYNLVTFGRASFPEGRPDGVLTPQELVPHILAMQEQAPPFDAKGSFRALGMAMIKEPARHRRQAWQRRHGGIWRKPGGHVLAASAACILALTSAPPMPATTITRQVRYVPVPLASGKPEAHTAYTLRPAARRLPARHAAAHYHRRHKDKEPMQVIAMSNGMASILEDGHIITLRPGQKSPHGWRLVRATPAYADMISPHGHHFHFTP